MIYVFFRSLLKFAFRAGYSRIELINSQYLKQDEAAIIICNHPSGFMEPILFASFLDVPLYFLVRGDLFKNRWFAWLLRATNQIPIFRAKDGFKSLRQNQKSMNESMDELARNKPILIFAEGSTMQTRKVRPLRKGCIRLLFDFLDQYPDRPIKFISAGINFVNPMGLGAPVSMIFNEPLDRRGIEGMRDEAGSEAKAVKALMNLGQEGIRSSVWNIEDDEREELFNDLLRHFKLSTKNTPIVNYKDDEVLSKGFSIANKLSVASAVEIDHFKKLNAELNDFKSRNGLSNWFVSEKNSLLNTILNLPLLIVFLIFVLPGYLAKSIAKKIVPDDEKEFYTSIYLSLGLILWFISSVIFIGITWWCFGGIASCVFILLMLILGIHSFRAKRYFVRMIDEIKFKFLSKEEKNVYSSLIQKLKPLI